MLCFASYSSPLWNHCAFQGECYPCVADLFTIDSSKDHFENDIIAFHVSESPWTFIFLSLLTWSQACLIYSSPRKFLFRDGLRRDHIVSEELQILEVFSCDSTFNRFSWEFLFLCLCIQCFLFCDCRWSSKRMIFFPPLLSEPLIIAIHLCYNLISLWAAVKKELLNPYRLCWWVCPFLSTLELNELQVGDMAGRHNSTSICFNDF